MCPIQEQYRGDGRPVSEESPDRPGKDPPDGAAGSQSEGDRGAVRISFSELFRESIQRDDWNDTPELPYRPVSVRTGASIHKNSVSLYNEVQSGRGYGGCG